MRTRDYLAAHPDLREGFADANGVRLHYVAKGQGPLLLLAHGFPEFWYGWHAQLEELGKDHLAVAVDLRGYNLSSKPEDVKAYRPQEIVEDLRQLARHFGAERFVLAGHDWGGAMSWVYANAHPETLDALIIVNAPHHGVFARELARNPVQQEASRYMLGFRESTAEEKLAADDFNRLIGDLERTSNGWVLSDEERDLYREAWSRPGALTGGLNYYRAARLVPPEPGEDNTIPELITKMERLGLMEVPVPTLLIWGELDHATKIGCVEGVERYVPDLELHRIPDGSHWILHEQPELTNRLIREFLEDRW
jgi:pimeloyl-ACP methyl ester carboxylesterase